jgi:hypothetical protein
MMSLSWSCKLMFCQPVFYQVHVKDEYPMLISLSNIREGSLVVWCPVFCRVYRLKVFCYHIATKRSGNYQLPWGKRDLQCSPCGTSNCIYSYIETDVSTTQ